ncbi:serine/threonine-protein kinase [Aquisphaera insulae]|uniref:serine/threonine-protein kinase n=1 Tax=Aquisphaera insulae TaxID=2712864 RepID=UPI0013EBE307|nr:serine/threonine-protein kinase [Aquisphaera insulae]
MPDPNEDLLLAALAVLTGVVPRDELRAAMAALAARPDAGLGRVLLEGGLLDGSRVDAMRVLAADHLARHGGDLASSLEAWKGEALTDEILTEIDEAGSRLTMARTLEVEVGSTIRAPESRGDPGAQATVAWDANATTGDVAGGGATAQRREQPRYTREQRFQRIELHARGGIGQVWKARDLELNREVALKEIRPNLGGQAGQKNRFLLEAEITGYLEHPGIVPVYSLGSDSQGRPFYAMRFVRGDSLSEAIQAFHRARAEAAASRRAEWGVEFQQLLRRFLEVCDAMEYAHSRGVLHRDLKPANIMLGEYGETLVVDWGLAKVLGRPDAAAVPTPPADDANPGDAPPDDATMPPPPPTAGGVTNSPTEHTVQGTKMGTPSYMSPEQARGEIDRLGTASDVYSLGATLYELLAGRRVHAGLKAQEILVRVARGDVPPPRTILATIPPALEAICRKAMAFCPEDRYASARDLALDLEHWIADEPVSAFPEGRAQRISRWLRQHRTWTYAAAASLLAITLVSTLYMVRLNAARRDAEAGFDAAISAVNQYLTEVSENELLKRYDTLDVSGLRSQLLQAALPFYKDFVARRGHDPRLREQLAGAYYRLGAITRFVGSTPEALGYYQSSLDLWRSLAAASPRDLDRRLRVADCLFAIGEISDPSHLEESIASLTEAVGIYKEAAAARPGEPRLLQSVATSLSEIGFRHSLASRDEDALRALGQARKILEDLIATATNELAYKKSLARVVNRIGYVEYHRGREDAAMAIYGEFQQVCRQILDGVKEGPRPLEFQELLAISYENIGAIQLRQGHREPALEAYREAEKIRARMVELAGSVLYYRAGYALTSWAMAHIEHDLGRIDESQAHLARAREILEKLCVDDPNELSYRRQLAQVAVLEGVIHDDAHRHAPALGLFEEALKIQEGLEPYLKDDFQLKVEVGVSLANLGETYADMGRPDLAVPFYRRALERRIAMLASRPDVPDQAARLAALAVTLGNIQRQRGEPAAAVATFTRALEALDRIPAGPGDDGTLVALRAQLLDRKARALAEQGKTEESSDVLKRAAGIAREALPGRDPAGVDATSIRAALSETLRDLALLPLPGRPAIEVDRLRAERANLWQGRPPQEPYALAGLEVVEADVVGYGKTPLVPAGEQARRTDRDAAASHLRIAVRRGLPGVDSLRADPVFGPLLRDGQASPDEPSPDLPRDPFRR